MTIVYRTDGAWGSGTGTNLAPAQVDGNFFALAGRVTYIEENPVEPIEPIAISISGSQFTMGLSNGEILGPIEMTMPVPQWRGDWVPAMPYAEMDFFIAPDGGMGAVMLAHTSAASFDWAALSGGVPVYRQMTGASGTTSGLADLIDVAIAGSAANDLLVYNAAANLWQNRTPAYTATTVLPPFTGSTGAAPGAGGMVPAPAAGDDVAGKVLGAGGGWVVPAGGGGGSTSLAGLSDVAIASPANLSLLQYSSTDGKWHNQTLATLGAGTVGLVDTGAGLTGGPITTAGTIALAPVASLNLLANILGGSSAPSGVSLSTFLDAVIGTGRGSILRRGGTGWSVLTPGADGTFLRSGGPAADITWGTPAGAGTVTSVDSGAGLTGGPITAAGTLSLAMVGDNYVLANISGATAPPSGTNLTLLLDHALGATRGMVLYRGATSWAALPAGASGAVLTSGGAGADPAWAAGAGLGTVTTVNTGGGIVGGPITTTGTVSLATIANQTVLANISGSTAVPAASTMSAILDAVFSSTRGGVLYRGAAGWAALGPGTSGNVLTTGGAGADPAWAAASGGGGLSGMTAGQIPLAATATTVTSSIPTTTFVARAGDTMTGPLVMPNNGTAAATSINFGAATTGIYGATNTITFATASTQRVQIGNADVTFAPRISASAGSAAAASIHFGTSNTGFYGGTTISATVGGANKLTLSGTNLTMAVPIVLPAGVTGAAPLNLPHGVAPSAPANGDLWTTTLGLYARVNGATVGPFGAGGITQVDADLRYVNVTGGDTIAGDLTVTGTLNVGASATATTKLSVHGASAAGQIAINVAAGPTGADTTTYLAAFSDAASATFLGGIVRTGTNGVLYTSVSDARLKSDIRSSDTGLDALLALRVCDYLMAGEKEPQQGLVAQEVAAIYPIAVHRGGDDPATDPWTLDYGRLTPLLIRAVQELAAEVAALKAARQ